MEPKRFRRLKKWGGSLVLIFNKMDRKDLNISEADLIDIDSIIIKRPEKKKKNVKRS